MTMSSTSQKDMKNYPQITLFILTSTELIIRIVFKKKDGYKLGLKKPKSMKLFDSTNKWIEKPI